VSVVSPRAPHRSPSSTRLPFPEADKALQVLTSRPHFVTTMARRPTGVRCSWCRLSWRRSCGRSTWSHR